jgi:hypothetical protein
MDSYETLGTIQRKVDEPYEDVTQDQEKLRRVPWAGKYPGRKLLPEQRTPLTFHPRVQLQRPWP